MSRSLFAISDEMREVAHALESEEFSDEDRTAALRAYWESTEKEVAEQAEAYAWQMKEFEHEVTSLEAEANRLIRLAKNRAAAINRMTETLRWFMDQNGLKKLDARMFKIAICENGGRAPINLLQTEIPPEYIRTTAAPDYMAIAKALDAGKTLPFAEYGERGSHVRIR